ncbi:MAG: 4-hydroxy-tetrahydrodipicolinate synthase [Dehalococcoidia bacterium]|nr:4-hydroxy-tetrahydrodipicolinate synthase [Dehalococcoidia bacterium]
MPELGRFLTAMVTPYDADGAVDFAFARRLARHLVDIGNDGVVVTGTTGEAPLLADEEKYRLWSEIKDELGETATVIAGSTTNDTHHSIELTRTAERAGVDGILAVAPYYLKPPQEGLYQHFVAVAGSTSLPVVVYNVPGRTGVNITVETMLRLAEVPNIVGDKEANGDMQHVSDLIEGAPDFKIWSGNDGDNFLIWCLGGYGAISVTGHLTAGRQRRMLDLVLSGDVHEAAAIHRDLGRVTRACFLNGNPSSVRYALRQFGIDVGAPRLPVVEPAPEVGERIMATLREFPVELPAEPLSASPATASVR